MSMKRSISPVDFENGHAKRPRLGQLEGQELKSELLLLETGGGALLENWSQPLALPTRHHFARREIQRSIAMVLSHDGFASATPEALESFTEMVETCAS